VPSDRLANLEHLAQGIDADPPLSPDLARAVAAINAQPVPLPSAARAIDHAARIDARRAAWAWWRRPRTLGLAASVAICVTLWQFATPTSFVRDQLAERSIGYFSPTQARDSVPAFIMPLVDSDGSMERMSPAPHMGPCFEPLVRNHVDEVLSPSTCESKAVFPPDVEVSETSISKTSIIAACHDDNDHPDAYDHLLTVMKRNGLLPDVVARFEPPRVVIELKDGQGKPLGGANIRIVADGEDRAVELPSRSTGRVVLPAGWDRLLATNPGRATLTVTPADGSPPVSRKFDRSTCRLVVELPRYRAALPTALDLAVVLDSTGTMVEELAFLVAEFESIANELQKRHPRLDVRFGLVLYRDDGDAYVTRSFDFTKSLDDFVATLRSQSAAGGGDHPEAMERGLEEALKLSWRAGADTCRLAVLFADAPPRDAQVERTLTAVDSLRRQGIGLVPIACAGADLRTEFVLRTAALLTATPFLFAHGPVRAKRVVPPVGVANYHVERLRDLLVRAISSELTGAPVPPKEKDVLRTIGVPVLRPSPDRESK
jgi:hypothetical protein